MGGRKAKDKALKLNTGSTRKMITRKCKAEHDYKVFNEVFSNPLVIIYNVLSSMR